MASHSLFFALKNLKGNARGCVYTEPMWGIPYNLYAPYVSVYMLALGLKDHQIGLIVSIGMAFQVLSALLSGAITDKLGRKRTTLIFDTIAWSIPMLVWAAAQNFTYFVIAAIINSIWRVTMTSWTCLLVEDTDHDQLVDIYAWIYVSGYLVAFFAPIAGLLVNKFTLVPTMRGLYLFAFVLMTAKFFLMNGMVTETSQGKVRLQETKEQSIFSLLGEYKGVFSQLLKTSRTLYTLGIMLAMSICMMISNTFWAILVTKRLQIPAEHLPLFSFGRSVFLLLFFFFVTPKIRFLHFKRPMLVGYAGFIISQVVLISLPIKSYLPLLASAILESCSMATVSPQIDRMAVTTVDPKERARIMSIMYVVVIIFTTPFGWLAGALSEMNRILPFTLSIGLFGVGALLTYLASRSPGSPGNGEEMVEEQMVAISSPETTAR